MAWTIAHSSLQKLGCPLCHSLTLALHDLLPAGQPYVLRDPVSDSIIHSALRVADTPFLADAFGFFPLDDLESLRAHPLASPGLVWEASTREELDTLRVPVASPSLRSLVRRTARRLAQASGDMERSPPRPGSFSPSRLYVSPSDVSQRERAVPVFRESLSPLALVDSLLLHHAPFEMVSGDTGSPPTYSFRRWLHDPAAADFLSKSSADGRFYRYVCHMSDGSVLDLMSAYASLEPGRIVPQNPTPHMMCEYFSGIIKELPPEAQRKAINSPIFHETLAALILRDFERLPPDEQPVKVIEGPLGEHPCFQLGSGVVVPISSFYVDASVRPGFIHLVPAFDAPRCHALAGFSGELFPAGSDGFSLFDAALFAEHINLPLVSLGSDYQAHGYSTQWVQSHLSHTPFPFVSESGTVVRQQSPSRVIDRPPLASDLPFFPPLSLPSQSPISPPYRAGISVPISRAAPPPPTMLSAEQKEGEQGHRLSWLLDQLGSPPANDLSSTPPIASIELFLSGSPECLHGRAVSPLRETYEFSGELLWNQITQWRTLGYELMVFSRLDSRPNVSGVLPPFPLAQLSNEERDERRLEQRRLLFAKAMTDGTKIAEALDVSPHVSAYLHERIPQPFLGPLPSFLGAEIENSEQAYELLRTLRDPRSESVKVLVLDKSRKVVASEIVHVGLIDECLLNCQTILSVGFRARKTTGQKRLSLLVSHNHPSGDPRPSEADKRVTIALSQSCRAVGFKLVDHIITNGDSYYSFAASSRVPLAKALTMGSFDSTVSEMAPRMAPWEHTPADDFLLLSCREEVDRLARSLQNQHPHNGHALFVNNQNRLVGVDLLRGKDLSPKALLDRILSSSLIAYSKMVHLSLPDKDLERPVGLGSFKGFRQDFTKPSQGGCSLGDVFFFNQDGELTHTWFFPDETISRCDPSSTRFKLGEPSTAPIAETVAVDSSPSHASVSAQERLRSAIETRSPGSLRFWDKLLEQLHLASLASDTVFEEILLAQDRAKELKGREVAQKMRRDIGGFITGQESHEFSDLQAFFSRHLWKLKLIPLREVPYADPWRTLDLTGSLNDRLDAVDRELVTQPVVNILNKLEETQWAEGLPPTATLKSLGITRLNAEAFSALDSFFGQDRWIIKVYGDDAFAGAGRSVLAAEQVKALVASNGGVFPSDGSFPSETRGDWMVQQRIDVQQQTAQDRAEGKLITEGSEVRVHITTTLNGTVKVIPYSTWRKGEWIPVAVKTPEIAGYEAAALAAVQSLPLEDRSGSAFGVDVVAASDGSFKVIELNPTKSGLISGYMEDNPFVQDALISGLKGRLPLHAKMARFLLSVKAKEEAKLYGVGSKLKGTKWRIPMLKHEKRTHAIRNALASSLGEGYDVFSPFGNSYITGIRSPDGSVIEQGSPPYDALPSDIKRKLDEFIWLSKEAHATQIDQTGQAFFSLATPDPSLAASAWRSIPPPTPESEDFSRWVEHQSDFGAFFPPPPKKTKGFFVLKAGLVSREPSNPSFFRLTRFYAIAADAAAANLSVFKAGWSPAGHQLFPDKESAFRQAATDYPSAVFSDEPRFMLARSVDPTPSFYDVDKWFHKMAAPVQEFVSVALGETPHGQTRAHEAARLAALFLRERPDLHARLSEFLTQAAVLGGFDPRVWYHGGKYTGSFPPQPSGGAFFASLSPDCAASYADQFSPSERMIIPLFVRSERLLNLTDPHAFSEWVAPHADESTLDSRTMAEASSGVLGSGSPLLKDIQKAGYEGFLFFSTDAANRGAYPSLAFFNPASVVLAPEEHCPEGTFWDIPVTSGVCLFDETGVLLPPSFRLAKRGPSLRKSASPSVGFSHRTELKRFDELTRSLQGRYLNQFALEQWQQANPEAFRELSLLRSAVLSRAGFVHGPYHHGRKVAFNSFDPARITQNSPLSFGFHFTSSFNEALVYATSVARAYPFFHDNKPIDLQDDESILSAFLRIQNPLIIFTGEASATTFEIRQNAALRAQIEQAALLGRPFDAVIVKRHQGDAFDGTSVVVFSPDQIKSASPLLLDDEGRLIPPNKWANSTSDIRFKIDDPGALFPPGPTSPDPLEPRSILERALSDCVRQAAIAAGYVPSPYTLRAADFSGTPDERRELLAFAFGFPSYQAMASSESFGLSHNPEMDDIMADVDQALASGVIDEAQELLDRLALCWGEVGVDRSGSRPPVSLAPIVLDESGRPVPLHKRFDGLQEPLPGYRTLVSLSLGDPSELPPFVVPSTGTPPDFSSFFDDDLPPAEVSAAHSVLQRAFLAQQDRFRLQGVAPVLPSPSPAFNQAAQAFHFTTLMGAMLASCRSSGQTDASLLSRHLLENFSSHDLETVLTFNPMAFPQGIDSLSRSLLRAIQQPVVALERTPLAADVSSISPRPFGLEDVAKVAREFSQTVCPDVPVVVTSSVAEWPPEMARLCRSSNVSPETVHGFVSNGVVYVHAPQQRCPEDVKKVILHEAVGHLGFSAITSAKDRARFFSILSSHSCPDLRALDQSVSMRYLQGRPVSEVSDKDQRLYLDEMFAAIVETHPSAVSSSVWSDLLVSLRTWTQSVLAKVGLANPDKAFIDSLVLRSRNAVRKGLSSRRAFGPQNERFRVDTLDLLSHPRWSAVLTRDTPPTSREIHQLQTFFRQNPFTPIRLYHGSAAPPEVLLREGVLPSSKTRRNSPCAIRGRSYWSPLPGIARGFGSLALSSSSHPKSSSPTVVAADFLPSELLPDKVQLSLERHYSSFDQPIPHQSNLAASLLFGRAASFRGIVSPYRLSVLPPDLASPSVLDSAPSRALDVSPSFSMDF